MEPRVIGRSGLRVGGLGLGTLAWGLDVDEDGAAALVKSFLDAGGSLIDTAPWYAGGGAEEVLARIVGPVVDRDEVVLCGKGGLDPATGPDASRRGMLRQLDRCLARLGTDHLDLWLWQDVDPGVRLEETLAALTVAVESGRVAYVGVANQPAWRVALAAARCDWPAPVVAAQGEYSLVARDAEADLLPCCRELEVGFIGWSGLGRGVLAGGYRHGVRADSRAAGAHLTGFVRGRLDDRSRLIAEALRTAADGLDRSPTEVAVAWVSGRPGVSCSLVGPRTPAQLVDCVRGVDLVLPAPIVSVLDEVSQPL